MLYYRYILCIIGLDNKLYKMNCTYIKVIFYYSFECVLVLCPYNTLYIFDLGSPCACVVL